MQVVPLYCLTTHVGELVDEDLIQLTREKGMRRQLQAAVAGVRAANAAKAVPAPADADADVRLGEVVEGEHESESENGLGDDDGDVNDGLSTTSREVTDVNPHRRYEYDDRGKAVPMRPANGAGVSTGVSSSTSASASTGASTSASTSTGASAGVATGSASANTDMNRNTAANISGGGHGVGEDGALGRPGALPCREGVGSWRVGGMYMRAWVYPSAIWSRCDELAGCECVMGHTGRGDV